MSLAGIAIAIGVLVDAAIVVTENAFRFLEKRGVNPRDRGQVAATVLEATKLVLDLNRRKAGRVTVAGRELDMKEAQVAERERQLRAEVRMKVGEVLPPGATSASPRSV